MGKSEKITELYRIIVNLNTIEECEMLFEDLCTKKEVEKMAERIYAAKLLLGGKTYNQVTEETDISSAKAASLAF